MTTPLHDVCAAVIPLPGLAALADVRCDPDVRVVLANERAWVTWRSSDDAVLRRLLAVTGAEFYRSTPGGWQRIGSRLPAVGVPFPGDAKPLQDVLTPASFAPRPVDDPRLRPVPLRLVRSEQPRHASALLARLDELGRWADGVPSARLAALEAARRGDWVLVRGRQLPTIAEARRFWGETLLLPLGWYLEPDLPAAAVRDTLVVGAEEIVLWTETGPEAIPIASFQPLSRASIRLAEEERTTQGV